MSDDEILAAIRENEDVAVTAVELSEEFDLTSAAIIKRLDSLADDGPVRKKKVGSSAVVWWLQDD